MNPLALGRADFMPSSVMESSSVAGSVWLKRGLRFFFFLPFFSRVTVDVKTKMYKILQTSRMKLLV